MEQPQPVTPQPITRDAFTRLTPVSPPEPLPPPERRWSDAEWARIRQGHKASDMDDRWHAFVEGDRLFVHRSWTGYGVFEARFTRGEDGWRISELLVCGDRERYRRGDDAREAAHAEAVIDGVLLGDWDSEAFARLRRMRSKPESRPES